MNVLPFVYCPKFTDRVTYVPQQTDSTWIVAQETTPSNLTLLLNPQTCDIQFGYVVDLSTLTTSTLPPSHEIYVYQDELKKDQEEEEEEEEQEEPFYVQRTNKLCEEWMTQVQTSSTNTLYTRNDWGNIQSAATTLLQKAFQREWTDKKKTPLQRLGDEDAHREWSRLCLYAHVILNNLFAFERKVGTKEIPFTTSQYPQLQHEQMLVSYPEGASDEERLLRFACESASSSRDTLVCIKDNMAWLSFSSYPVTFHRVCMLEDLLRPEGLVVSSRATLRWSLVENKQGWDRIWTIPSTSKNLPTELAQDVSMLVSSSSSSSSTSLITLLARHTAYSVLLRQ